MKARELALLAAGVVLTILMWASGGLRTYADDHKGLSERITVVETKQKADDQRLERMESKIDRLLEHVR